MTAKEQLHEFVEELDEGEAKSLLAGLRNGSDRAGDRLTEEELEAHDRGLADVAAGHFITLEELVRETSS